MKFLLTFLLPLTFCNIWDNIFGNYNAPNINIASNFHVSFGIMRFNSPYIMNVYYSSDLKAAKFICIECIL